MNRPNYDRDMQAIIDQVQAQGQRPRLLLHCCCAPCSTAAVERLLKAFQVDLYFHNPNLDTRQEHDLRADELKRLAFDAAPEARTIVAPYAPETWRKAIVGLEQEPEGGRRCEQCFKLRLQDSARYAKENGYDWFTTTLTISPMKDAGLLNDLGSAAGEAEGIPFLCSDFKKRGGYQRSIELSKAYHLYRQDYCGCVFSKRESEKRKALHEHAAQDEQFD